MTFVCGNQAVLMSTERAIEVDRATCGLCWAHRWIATRRGLLRLPQSSVALSRQEDDGPQGPEEEEGYFLYGCS